MTHTNPADADDHFEESDDEELDVGNESKKVVYQHKTPSIQCLYEQYKE